MRTIPHRTSGRDLTEVRRPARPVALTDLKKSELVEMAREAGVAVSGSKDDLVERLSESTDGE